MLALPDDVVLRTTSFQGTIAQHCSDALAAVVASFPEGRERDSPMFEALLDFADHLQASSFSALHGFYRQAFATLRTALEVMIVTTRIALEESLKALRAWRYDEEAERRIRPVVDLDALMKHAVIQSLNDTMVRAFAAQSSEGRRKGWVWDTYQLLSKFAHNVPGYTDGELWKSNGPVWVEGAFVLYIRMMREVLAIAVLFARVADPELILDSELIQLLTIEGEEWAEDLKRGLRSLGVGLHQA